jgi:hypothetical protein
MSNIDYKYKYVKYKSKYIENQYSNQYQSGGAKSKPSIELLLEKFYEHIIQIKLLHFQTETFGSHKALDTYLIKFDVNFDRFMEVAQSDHKVKNKTMDINIKMTSDKDVSKVLSKFNEDILKNAMEELYSDNPDLLAIRDEMLADSEQLKYLLRFK